MMLNVMTYNIHGGKDKKGKLRLNDVADVIKQSKVDIVALQEVDKFAARSKFINEIWFLSKKLRMCYAYGANIMLGIGFFGNGILSKFPIKLSQNYYLPSKGERRGILITHIILPDNNLWFLTTHLGLDANERINQTEEILKIIKRQGRPLILTGDFNETPGNKAYNRLKEVLVETSEKLSFDYSSFALGNEPDTKIDYIMHTNDIIPKSIGTIMSDCSDHLPVISTLNIPVF